MSPNKKNAFRAPIIRGHFFRFKSNKALLEIKTFLKRNLIEL